MDHYYDRYLVLRRENGRIRMYEEHGQYRVYNGCNLVYQGNDVGIAYRTYNREV